ncbi:CDP-glycerol glycerophosphotransferase family protein [Thermodesulfobacteriota bacterium]
MILTRKLKKKIKRIIYDFYEIIKILFFHLCTLFPINKKLIVFESQRGLSYSCNPKYIYEELLKYDNSYQCVWSFQDINTQIIGPAIKVNRFSPIYYYYLARAKFWIQNGEFGKKIKRRNGTIYINTQHGTPLKKMGIDIPYFNDKKGTFEKTSKWDYLISPNKYTMEIFKRAYRYSGAFLETGYPRNDIFYTNNKLDMISSIKRKLQIPLDKKVALYAPTWRDYERKRIAGKDQNKGFDPNLNYNLLYDKLSNEYVIILRFHHLTYNKVETDRFDGFIFDFSKSKYDIQELCLISDVLITDYSSIMFDYANLKRPMLFYTYDIDDYENSIRGFYLDFPKMAPGPLLYNTEELLYAILNIDTVKEEYREKEKSFFNQFCYLEDGNAAKRIVEKFF